MKIPSPISMQIWIDIEFAFKLAKLQALKDIAFLFKEFLYLLDEGVSLPMRLH